MNKISKIILIGNYLPDRQESMIRFANMMARGLQALGMEAEIWWPQVILGSVTNNTTSGIGKWLGYLDKYIVFPLILLYKLRDKKINNPKVYFHICDHSNAPYLQHLPSHRAGITCHDVIAIRGGLGYKNNQHPASNFGKILQRWILYNLCRSKFLASVSQSTLKQLTEMAPKNNTSDKDWKVIYNSFNADFKPMSSQESYPRLVKAGIHPQTPFILHVGSEQPRKNRKLLLDMVSKLGSDWLGNICFAGKALDQDLIDYSHISGLQNRTISIINPDHETLVALYSNCEAFIFPSFSEGFGWPLIEAQACGAPVITSNIEPMLEVTGGVSLYANPNKAEEFAEAFLLLKDDIFRSNCIKLGIMNAKRFDLSLMINEYLGLYNKTMFKSQASWS